MQQKYLELCYLYRDSGNYKWYQSLIFPIRAKPDLENWEQSFRKLMQEGEWIKPYEMQLPLIQDAPHDEGLEEVFYELHELSLTEEKPNQKVYWEDWLEALPEIVARFDRVRHYKAIGSIFNLKICPPFQIELP